MWKDDSAQHLPCWAPSSITCSLEMICPAITVLVVNEIKVEGWSPPGSWARAHPFSRAKVKWSHILQKKAITITNIDQDSYLGEISWHCSQNLWKTIMIPQSMRRLLHELQGPDSSADLRRIAACSPSPVPDAAIVRMIISKIRRRRRTCL